MMKVKTGLAIPTLAVMSAQTGTAERRANYKYPRHQRTITSATAAWEFPRLAAATIGLLLFCPCAQSESLVDSALKLFLGNDSNTPGFDLDKSRPQPATPAVRALILASLPKEGLVQKLQDPLRRKLDSLETVLRVQQRHSVYELRVFKTDPTPFAFVGLDERAVILISDSALTLLDAVELQAAVAHEIGHEYVWADYLDATKRHDYRRLKELELFCDGVAILTLRRAGLDPASLLTAAERITIFNLMNTGQAWNAERYPSGDERRRFAKAIGAWADSHGYPDVAAK